MSSLATYHPFKALYALLAVAFETARFPVWILLYLVPSFRPHKSWTFRQALGVKVVRLFLHHSATVEVKTPYSLRPGREGKRFVTYEPAPADTYKGPLVDKEIKPATVGGTWSPKAPIPSEIRGADLDVVLHFHGGAYVIGDGRDHDTGFLAKTFLKHARVTHVFTPNYRLSSNPGGRFPAAFQDAVSSYYYLTKTLGIPADRITISGDSAGGNLAFALLRYITDYGKEVSLQAPACAWFWSPWVNVEAARDPTAMLASPNYWTDYLGPGFGTWGAKTFAPLGSGIDLESPYLAPIGHPFKTKTPLFVHTGSAEVLYDDDVEIAGQFKKEGCKVQLVVSEGTPHDIILVGHLMGFAKQTFDAAKKAGDFLRLERAKL